jgi:hypothetical protein
MAGLGGPWASRGDALFWSTLLRMALFGALAVVAGALANWALLLQPGLHWWRDEVFVIARDAASWTHWRSMAVVMGGVLGMLFFGFLAWYCGLLGSGKAAH